MAAHFSHSGHIPADRTCLRSLVIRAFLVLLALLLPGCTPAIQVRERSIMKPGLSQASLSDAAAAWGTLRSGLLPEAAALAEYNRATLAASL